MNHYEQSEWVYDSITHFGGSFSTEADNPSAKEEFDKFLRLYTGLRGESLHPATALALTYTALVAGAEFAFLGVQYICDVRDNDSFPVRSGALCMFTLRAAASMVKDDALRLIDLLAGRHLCTSMRQGYRFSKSELLEQVEGLRSEIERETWPKVLDKS